MRERAVLETREEHVVELQALGRMERDEEDAFLLVRVVGVGPERHGVEKARGGRVVPLASVRGRALVLACGGQ